MTPSRAFPATVVKLLASDRLVINRGSDDGLRVGFTLVVYGLDKEPIVDPSTGQDLGRLELPKGHGTVIHVQEHLAILFNKDGIFHSPVVGDFAKPV